MLVNAPNAEKDDFRCDFKRLKWEEKTSSGRVAIPYAFHWTFPEKHKKVFNNWLKDKQENDVGCIEFVLVTGTEANPITKTKWKNGIMVLWNSYSYSSTESTPGNDVYIKKGCKSDKGNSAMMKSNSGRKRGYGKWKDIKNAGFVLNEDPDAQDKEVSFDKADEDKEQRFTFRMFSTGKKNKEFNQYREGWQQVQFSDSCMVGGTVQHEMMHGLGFMHEQSNPVRNVYISADKDIIEEEDTKRTYSAFQIIQPRSHAISPYPFELGSLMMYGPRIYGQTKQTNYTKVAYKPNFTQEDKIGMTYRVSIIILLQQIFEM